jgi:hypothetical protein
MMAHGSWWAKSKPREHIVGWIWAGLSPALDISGSRRVGGLDSGPSLMSGHDPTETSHAFLMWVSWVFGSADKRARGAAGGGCEDEPCDHADAESQDEQGSDQTDPGQQHSHEDGKTDGEYGYEKNGGHRVTVTFQPWAGMTPPTVTRAAPLLGSDSVAVLEQSGDGNSQGLAKRLDHGGLAGLGPRAGPATATFQWWQDLPCGDGDSLRPGRVRPLRRRAGYSDEDYPEAFALDRQEA